MPKRIKKLRRKVQSKTTEKEKTATKRRTKKKAAANRRRRKARKLKRKVTQPAKEAKGLAGDVKDLTKAQAEALASRVPGSSSTGSPVSRRQKQRKQKAKQPDKSADGDDELSEREAKILFAQQLRNQGLTTSAIADQVGMSPSWVSSNTQAVPASQTPEASDDLEQSSDGFLGAIQDVEAGLFGGDLDGDGIMEGGVDIDLSDLDKGLDKQLSGLDDQFGDID